MKKFVLIAAISGLIFSFGCQRHPELATSTFKIEFNQQLHTRINNAIPGAMPLMDEFQASDYLHLDGGVVKDFALQTFRFENFKDQFGSGRALQVSGLYKKGAVSIQKKVTVKAYDQFATFLVFNVEYVNRGTDTLKIEGWTNHHYRIRALPNEAPLFWSFQAASYPNRPDWVLPLIPDFKQRNYQGMNASDYGGGVPVVDIWRSDAGLAIGHLATKPQLVALPVQCDSTGKQAEMALTMETLTRLAPGAVLKTLPSFVAVHTGDFFNTLQTYATLLKKAGLKSKPYPKTAYQPVWCAWGYERNFKVEQIVNTLPKVKELGIDWVVIDDGWQTAEGDWFLNPKKFPHGDRDMRALVDKIHAMGLKAKLWLVPLAADPGTQLLKKHPERLLLNEKGKPQLITWWDSYYLCPAYEPNRTYTQKLIRKILKDWDFDGLKLDGQHQNAVPPCYNPAHKHDRPQQSVEALPDFYQMIYQTAMSIKPDAVVEICPCGDAASVFNMMAENQPVASDPTSSWQIRLKGKTYKALMGADVPYYGDHVELSDGKDDFASTIGVGGVPGTKFIWPPGVHLNSESGDVSLTPEKEKKWKKWLNLYRQYDLASGTYLGALYDIGYDRPEAHVIKKDGRLFYAFFAPEYQGRIELRGLSENKTYQVTNYETGQKLGTVSGKNPFLAAKFHRHLLLRVE